MVVNKFSVVVTKIKSVEKGNILTSTNPVIAFTVEDTVNGKPIKCIVKGDLAIALWDNFLTEGKSRDKILTDQSTKKEIRKEVFVSFEATLKEEREKEVVLENLSNVSFSFVYNIA